jgi:hypothetical protein
LGLFLTIEGGGVVFELHEEHIGVVGTEKSFGFAFVEQTHRIEKKG